MTGRVVLALKRHHALFAGAALCLAAASAFASDRLPAEQRTFPYDAQIPLCDDPGVTGLITERFATRETNFWKSNLVISGFDRVRQTAFRPIRSDFIPRRYCHARALTSDGHYRHITYSVVEDAMTAGLQGTFGPFRLTFPTPSTFDVFWCIQGLERHRSFGGDCRAAGP